MAHNGQSDEVDNRQMAAHRIGEEIDINRKMATQARAKGNASLGDAYDVVYRAQMEFAQLLQKD